MTNNSVEPVRTATETLDLPVFIRRAATESLVVVEKVMLGKRYTTSTLFDSLATACLGLLAALTQSTNDAFREGEAAVNEISSNFSSSSKCEEHFRLCGGAAFIVSVDWAFILLQLVLHPSFVDRMELTYQPSIFVALCLSLFALPRARHAAAGRASCDPINRVIADS